MNNLSILPMNFSQFSGWYEELGKLKIFWSKPLNDIKLISTDDEGCLLEIEWIVRKQIKKSVMCIVANLDYALKVVRKIKYADITKLIVVPEDCLRPPRHVDINARSILYFWDVHSKTLESNSKVEIVRLLDWGDATLETFRQIHRRGWGFFMPPRKGDHVVLLAYLENTPVGMAYLNKHNLNRRRLQGFPSHIFQ